MVEAPAIVFDNQEAVMAAFERGELERDFVAVVRFQGPRANGMPELHKLTPLLGVLQDQGFHVALVTDGRMSGASGKVPAAIHVTPECLAGGPLARVRDGDMILLDGDQRRARGPGRRRRVAGPRSPSVADLSDYHHGMGRELFAAFRANALGAEQGAVTFNASEPQGTRAAAPVASGPRPLRLHAGKRRMNILELMRIGPVIPVIVIDHLEHAVPLARALVAGGVRVLEVTLRTPVALQAIRAIASEVDGAIVGVGTITRARRLRRGRSRRAPCSASAPV